ncbi:MAG: gluconate 2-dehydrogenase subunit 3 family protein [Acidobacteria bacterium]|nr:gluconate 2-dehydrogenase subunit 3 family protein [Acidobacteriota bacterium]
MRDHLQNPGRREVIRRLALGAGGLVTLPFVGAAHPIQHHLRDADALALADARSQTAEYTPAFLTAHQLETLRLLGERILPGSSKANSAEFIDQLLTVAADAEQRAFLRAMSAFEQLALTRFNVPWKHLTGDQQDELLTRASTEKPGAAARGAAAPARITIRDQFEQLKGWIVGAYYSSEIGMRELGWTGNVFFSEFPGCTHADGHH